MKVIIAGSRSITDPHPAITHLRVSPYTNRVNTLDLLSDAITARPHYLPVANILLTESVVGSGFRAGEEWRVDLDNQHYHYEVPTGVNPTELRTLNRIASALRALIAGGVSVETRVKGGVLVDEQQAIYTVSTDGTLTLSFTLENDVNATVYPTASIAFDATAAEV